MVGKLFRHPIHEVANFSCDCGCRSVLCSGRCGSAGHSADVGDGPQLNLYWPGGAGPHIPHTRRRCASKGSGLLQDHCRRRHRGWLHAIYQLAFVQADVIRCWLCHNRLNAGSSIVVRPARGSHHYPLVGSTSFKCASRTASPSPRSIFPMLVPPARDCVSRSSPERSRGGPRAGPWPSPPRVAGQLRHP